MIAPNGIEKEKERELGEEATRTARTSRMTRSQIRQGYQMRFYPDYGRGGPV